MPKKASSKRTDKPIKRGRYVDLASSQFEVKLLKGLRWYFSLIVFCILAGSALLVMIFALVIDKLNWLHRVKDTLLIIGLLGASLIIGTVIAVILSREVLRPINTLSSAMRRVAEGDFAVKLNENTSLRFVHQLNSDFNNMVGELSTVDTLRNDFISNVSHEFKTPLAAIEGYASLLQDPSLSNEQKSEYVEKILVSSKRLSALVGNILTLSKLDNEAMPLARERYRIDEQVRICILALETKWMEKEIEFDVNMDSIEFSAIEALMNHVFSNLVDNAIKFSPHGGTIYVSLSQTATELHFSIANSGPPIDEETMKHMFEKFYQGDTSHKSEGNGLGLSLVSKIVSLHHGSVSAKNTGDGLVEFAMILPIE